MPRSKPFSGKQKKFQLQAKRQTKKGREDVGAHSKSTVRTYHQDSSSESTESLTTAADDLVLSTSEISSHRLASHTKTSFKTSTTTRSSKDRYKLVFDEESKDEIAKRKERSMQPYTRRSPEEMESGVELFYDPPIMFPVRPSWDYSLSAEALDRREKQYFQKYREDFLRDHSLGYCELNLETWRQLWRVLEMSDVLLHIVDVRFTSLHFNPALYNYVTQTLNKQVIVVLNKCDIVPAEVAVAWKHYLLKEFPRLEVVMFTSFPKDEETREALSKGKQSRRRKKKAAAIGPLELWNVCHKLVKQEINIDSWKSKIMDDMKITDTGDITDSDQSDCGVEEVGEKLVKSDLTFSEHTKYKDGVLTIGCVGYPNVGKSSVINGLMGRKVVSISKTPGHTKHFQTIFLTNNVKLCDCPGLVFPSTAPRPVQVLAGMYPVSQLREPYSVVQYLAERCDLPACLGLRLPEDERQWSAYLICDELAELKGFKTGRGSRNDPYRAANWILRSSLEGKMFSYHLPPGFCREKGEWLVHPESVQLRNVQSLRLEATRSAFAEDSWKQSADPLSSSSDEMEAPTVTTNPFNALVGDT